MRMLARAAGTLVGVVVLILVMTLVMTWMAPWVVRYPPLVFVPGLLSFVFVDPRERA